MTDLGIGGGAGRSRGDPLRVGVLTSARAPGLERLLVRSGEADAPYRVVAVVGSDDEGGGLEAAREAGVPTAVHDPEIFCAERGETTGDAGARRAFDRELVRTLRRHGVESVMMCGYLWIATDELLGAFPDAVFNIHDADLTIRDADGEPRYRGLRSTRDAVAAGEPETRTTVHLATERVDVGPPLLLSPAFPVHPLAEDARNWGADDLLSAYAYAQRGWMMRSCWGPMLDRTLELFARGRIGLPSDGPVSVAGESAPLLFDERIEVTPRRVVGGLG